MGLTRALPLAAELALALGLRVHSQEERRPTLESPLDDRDECRLFLGSELLALEVLMTLR